MEMHKFVKRDAHVDMDMTPMIDIVFLLIIFFMLVTELSKLDIEEVVLPIADTARVEEPQAESRQITLNVALADGEGKPKMIISGQKYSAKELAEHLKLETEVWDHWIPNPNDTNQRDSTLEVLIRGDQHAFAGAIHDIYKACSDAKIFKVRIAALSERLESAYKDD